MIETLVENAKYMPQNGQDASSGPSLCEVECKSQQANLLSCMNIIRDARESNPSSEAVAKNANACLAPSVASWTECCAKANAADQS